MPEETAIYQAEVDASPASVGLRKLLLANINRYEYGLSGSRAVKNGQLTIDNCGIPSGFFEI